ncbi:3-hydroxyacyl-CoA dehydrogenase NAD-binding domain-containing protein [Janibacter terrae]|uniref:3-hydroxyacyl-CoA dehydrogenase NAD-binding domain-containing protein n=1 Tax=Janibacter terrae TaxID=103817 RepID=UPI0031FA0182
MSVLGPVVCVGGGRMGRGIAVAHVLGDIPVTLLDVKERDAAGAAAFAEAVHADVRGDLERLVGLGALAPERSQRCAALVGVARPDETAQVLAAAGLVYEAVPETEEAKRAAFALISEHVAAGTPVGSTTSAMLVTELAGQVTHPGRFLNTHWLNPAFVVPLVELSVHPGTDPEIVAAVRAHLEAIGKVPVVCGPTPGYIVPRLQALIMNEAARLVDEGVANPQDVDTATRYGLGFRFASMGVLEFIDYGGNDTLFHAGRYLAEHVDEHRYAVPDIVERHMDGRNGLRDGVGFHEYPAQEQEAYRADVLTRLLRAQELLGAAPERTAQSTVQH